MAFPHIKKSSNIQTALGLVLVAGAIGVALLITKGYLLITKPTSDPLLAKVIENVAKNIAYIQHVETETSLSDRDIRVVGDYMVNHKSREYYSVATTTLTLPDTGQGREKHSFTLSNIAIVDDVYTKIDTESELLKKTIPHSVTWRHFKSGQIPPEFENIAIAGPILDNLRIFDERGRYMVIIKKHGYETFQNENLMRYTLSLSDSTPPEGTLGVILNRIGKNGHIDAWVDAKNHMIRHLHFENGEYRSTTTIETSESTPPLSPPV